MALRGGDQTPGMMPGQFGIGLLLRDKECGGDPTRRGNF
jgi:hypothetical protein